VSLCPEKSLRRTSALGKSRTQNGKELKSLRKRFYDFIFSKCVSLDVSEMEIEQAMTCIGQSTEVNSPDINRPMILSCDVDVFWNWKNHLGDQYSARKLITKWKRAEIIENMFPSEILWEVYSPLHCQFWLRKTNKTHDWRDMECMQQKLQRLWPTLDIAPGRCSLRYRKVFLLVNFTRVKRNDELKSRVSGRKVETFAAVGW